MNLSSRFLIRKQRITLRKFLEHTGYTEMYIRGKCFLAILSTGIFLSVSAAGNPYEMMLTNNKDIENRLIFSISYTVVCRINIIRKVSEFT